jgi:hypothetical protein
MKFFPYNIFQKIEERRRISKSFCKARIMIPKPGKAIIRKEKLYTSYDNRLKILNKTLVI